MCVLDTAPARYAAAERRVWGSFLGRGSGHILPGWSPDAAPAPTTKHSSAGSAPTHPRRTWRDQSAEDSRLLAGWQLGAPTIGPPVISV